MPELLVMIEDLYKHTLESLLKDNSDDIEYFHNELCSDDAKVHSALQVCVHTYILTAQRYIHVIQELKVYITQCYHSFMFLQLDFHTEQFREAI